MVEQRNRAIELCLSSRSAGDRKVDLPQCVPVLPHGSRFLSETPKENDYQADLETREMATKSAAQQLPTRECHNWDTRVVHKATLCSINRF
jgi:hypothetical protein